MRPIFPTLLSHHAHLTPVIFTEVNMVFNSAFTSDFQRTVIHVHEYKRSLFTTCYSFSRLCAIRSTLKNDASLTSKPCSHQERQKAGLLSEIRPSNYVASSVNGLRVTASYLEASIFHTRAWWQWCYEMGLCQVRYHILVTSSCAPIGGATRYKPCYSASSTGKQCSITSAICAKVNP